MLSVGGLRIAHSPKERKEKDMTTIEFDFNKLNKKEQAIYLQMNDSEKADYERIWIQIETQKLRLEQCRNRSKVRNQREKKFLAEKDRRERTHRLIERGAILEAYIDEAADFSNDQIKDIVARAFNTDHMRRFIADLRLYKADQDGMAAWKDNESRNAGF